MTSELTENTLAQQSLSREVADIEARAPVGQQQKPATLVTHSMSPSCSDVEDHVAATTQDHHTERRCSIEVFLRDAPQRPDTEWDKCSSDADPDDVLARPAFSPMASTDTPASSQGSGATPLSSPASVLPTGPVELPGEVISDASTTLSHADNDSGTGSHVPSQAQAGRSSSSTAVSSTSTASVSRRQQRPRTNIASNRRGSGYRTQVALVEQIKELVDAENREERRTSSLALLGDLADQMTFAILGDPLENIVEEFAEGINTSEAQTPNDQQSADDSDSQHSEIADLGTGTVHLLPEGHGHGRRMSSGSGSQNRGKGQGEGQGASGLSRLSTLFVETLWPSLEDNNASEGGSTSSSPTLPNAGHRQHIDLDALREEVRKPFQLLLDEIPEPGKECEAYLAKLVSENAKRRKNDEDDDGEDDDDDDENGGSPLVSAVARSSLIGRVLGCCDAVLCELSTDEVHLWDAFILANEKLTGSVTVGGQELKTFLGQLSRSQDVIAGWTKDIALWADEVNEVEFADILDWFDGERQKNNIWTFQSSLRKSFVQLMGSSNPQIPTMRLRPELLTILRNRLSAMPLHTLGAVCASVQRVLVLTSWCQCQRRLLSLVTPAIVPLASSGEPLSPSRGPLPGPVSALVAVLRGINAELAPTEKVLWELLGTKDVNFAGTNDKPEVLDAIGELLVYSIERELETSQSEFEELQSLRADCRRNSIESLFEDTGRSRVCLAEILRWWWDMSEEYRVAAGFGVPAALLRRSFHRRPEEMFREQLPKMATNPAAAKVALEGHSRALAELRALAVSRALETLQGTNAQSTMTTNSTNSPFPSSPREQVCDPQGLGSDEPDQASVSHCCVFSAKTPADHSDEWM